MTPRELLETVINPALELLPEKMTSDAAKAMLICIALQESGDLNTRTQRVRKNNQGVDGPARGLGQFEMNGGVKGVLNHKLTKDIAIDICEKFNIQPDKQTVWENLKTNDILACCFARLLLGTVSGKLPERNNSDLGGRQYSKQSWNPGKPHPEKGLTNGDTAWSTINEI